MSHIINTCSWQTRDKARQSQLGKEEREQIQGHMDLSTLSSSNGNLSLSKSMHVSELTKGTSAQIRSQRSDGKWQRKISHIWVEIYLQKERDESIQMRHKMSKCSTDPKFKIFSPWELLDHCTLCVLHLCSSGLGPLTEISYGYCPFRPQCKHGTDTRPIIFVKDIQWKQGRERALNPWQGAYTMAHGVCTGHTTGSWDNWECLSSFQPLPCIHTCSTYSTVHTYSTYVHTYIHTYRWILYVLY